ncbi:hypothetical protein BLNAU_18536 [Blattamonas nauphoetae]|uniref:Uncharacterized protein n=1 Tax=Blattamonas nauphoetae TaxID=2049346 RepID=A0ABQ9X4E7_9EUKA|nr:hypothetical protein BLNAU_18536 [Blattamonas nauphoetae]
MGSNISRHIQPDKSDLPPSLGDDDLNILRRIQVIIDTCVGVLKQSDFLDFDNPLTNEQLSDLSHLLYQSFQTQKAEHNDRYSLKQYLFRSSIFSLFGHVILNSQAFINYTKNINTEVIYKILHVITGTPGMGKSASRFPFITLLLSSGVESVTTKKGGERVYVFKRKNKVRTGMATISMDDHNGALPDFSTLSYLYTYDVHSFEEPKRSDVDAEKIDKTKEKVYMPDALKLPGPKESKPGWTHLGSVSVPSVEYFPYFLRLLVGHQSDTLTKTNPPNVDNQICQGSPLVVVNRLENTKWHVVDDITFSERSMLERDTNYVLFTSPKGSRWNQFGADDKTCRCLTLEYVVPKYTSKEQAALLNTMGTQNITPDELHQIHQGVEHFSFVPRYVLQKETAIAAVNAIHKSGKDLSIIESDDLFAEKVSHKLIHFSCPQYDCHNWHTEFATELARWITLDTFNDAMEKEYAITLENLSRNPEFNQQRGAVFHAFVSEAILGGFCLTNPQRLVTSKKQPLTDGVQLPEPIGESFVYLRNTVCMRKASLPDIKRIHIDELKDFDEKWAPLFPTHTLPQETQLEALMNRDDSNAKCFTFYLKPIGGNNAGFDSLLLFFKVHEEQGELKLDDLSAMFIQSTLASEHPISVSGVNLMYLWRKLLCRVYELSEQHIRPLFFFVKQSAVEKFHLKGNYPADSFIPQDDVWVMDCHALKKKEIMLARTGRLLLSSAATLQPNTNPTHFRCYFCDQIITEFFPDHHCEAIPDKYEEALKVESEQDGSNRDTKIFPSRQTDTGQNAARHIFEFNLISTQPPNLDTEPDGPGRHVDGINLGFPYPDALIPKSNRGMSPFDMMDVVMVGVGGQPESSSNDDSIPNEQDQKKLRFEVSHTHPIPPFFTYFPRRPDDPQPSVPTTEPWNEEGENTVASNESSNPTSHLLASVCMIDMWANKQRIGFGGQMGDDVLSMGEQHPPHETFSALFKQKEVPLACIHLPMDTFPKQTLLLGTRQILTPFEIRGILSLLDKKYPIKDESDEPRQLMISNYIDDGQPLTWNDAEDILSDGKAFPLLLASDLDSLKTEIPTLSSLLPYNLQTLAAFVSGTLALITDILGKCMIYLSRPKKLNGTAAQKLKLKWMKICLQRHFSVACDRLNQALELTLLGKRRDLSDADVELVVEGMRTNPLLPERRRKHVFPFVTDVTKSYAELVKLLSQEDGKLKRKDREVCITVLLIHAPIEESEKVALQSLIDKCSQHNQALEPALTSLLVQDGLSTDVDKWNEILNDLEQKKTLDMSSRTLLRDCLQKPRGVSENKAEIVALIEQEPFSEKTKETLVSLVNGTPRLTSSRRTEIATLCRPSPKYELEGTIVKAIKKSKLAKDIQTELEDIVRARKPINDEEITRLKKLIETNGALEPYKEDLRFFFDRSQLLFESDQSLVLSSCLAEIRIVKQYLIDLFNHFDNRFLDTRSIRNIGKTLQQSKTSLQKKQKHLFANLKTSLSWKDLSALLCFPNGSGSTPLPGLNVLFPKQMQERKRENSTYSQLSFLSREEMDELFVGEPSTFETVSFSNRLAILSAKLSHRIISTPHLEDLSAVEDKSILNDILFSVLTFLVKERLNKSTGPLNNLDKHMSN